MKEKYIIFIVKNQGEISRTEIYGSLRAMHQTEKITIGMIPFSEKKLGDLLKKNNWLYEDEKYRIEAKAIIRMKHR